VRFAAHVARCWHQTSQEMVRCARLQVVGQTGRHQAAAAYAVYGPQTMLVWARPSPKPTAEQSHIVQQFLLGTDGSWTLVPSPAGLGQGPVIKPTLPIFAPANLRAAAQNKVRPGPDAPLHIFHMPWLAAGASARGRNPSASVEPGLVMLPLQVYAALVDDWIAQAFTLRYTGGMVPDVGTCLTYDVCSRSRWSLLPHGGQQHSQWTDLCSNEQHLTSSNEGL
jgi:hypothetical protein